MLTFYIKTYGCQMNIADGEIIDEILIKNGYQKVSDIYEANIVMFNTCSIRDKAEQTLLNKLDFVKGLRKLRKNDNIVVGILGCMAQAQQTKLLEHDQVDFIVGPDEYRSLPEIVSNVLNNKGKIRKTEFSTCETYSDIIPHYSAGVSAFIPISRGCNNFCSYCVVPYTRGRERSRDIDSIIKNVEYLSEKKYKEITLLGQNVDAYTYKDYNFAKLLDTISDINKDIRIRFLSSHPKYFTREVVEVMAKHKNICKNIQLPVQSGSNKILKLMNRSYTREQYIEQIKMIRSILGEEVGISTDIICGFCDETQSDHEETLSLMQEIKFDYSFIFIYSEREGTYSAKYLKDNVDKETKTKRFDEILSLQGKHSLERYQKCIGKKYEVLIEGCSKRDKNELCGRTDTYKMVVIKSPLQNNNIKPGDMVDVNIASCTSATLIGNVL